MNESSAASAATPMPMRFSSFMRELSVVIMPGGHTVDSEGAAWLEPHAGGSLAGNDSMLA